jgi:hypothetical protein
MPSIRMRTNMITKFRLQMIVECGVPSWLVLGAFTNSGLCGARG